MGEIIGALGAAERQRIAELRARHEFFWIDISLADVSRDELGEALGIPPEASAPLVDLSLETAPSRKFYADGQRVVFVFSCFLESEPGVDDAPKTLRPIEGHVLVCGDYILTVHQERVSLPELLRPTIPEGRSEQYGVYAILGAMAATAFDALNEAELTIEGLQATSTDLRAARLRMATLRSVNARLSEIRRRIGPQRGTFERISEEVRQIEGLEPDSEHYFERIYAQLNRLIDGIDAADNGLAKLIDLRLNETIYWLTVVATIFLPLTFVTGFFGMNFAWMTDRIDTPLAFIVLGIGAPMLGVVLTLLLVRRRGTPVEADQDTLERRLAKIRR